MPTLVLLCLFLALTVQCASAQTAAPARVIAVELEAARHAGGGVDEKPGASGGKCLGGGWGHQAGDWAEVEFTLPATGDRVAGIRYAWDAAQLRRRFPAAGAHGLRLLLDGHEVAARVPVPDTSDWNVFTWLRVPLGRLTAGRHTLYIESPTDLNDLNLDRLEVGGPSYAPDTCAATEWPTHSHHFRVRLSPHVDAARFPARQVFTNLEAQYAYLRDLLGFEPTRLILLTVIAADEWNAGGATAYTGYGNLYMQVREILTPGNNYAHEMFHAFEAGLDCPTWWSEGAAYLAAARSDAEVYARPEADIEADAEKLREWWQREGERRMVRDGANQVQWWGSDRLPADIPTRALYRVANLIVYSLWKQEGDDFLRRLYGLIHADQAAGRYGIPGAPAEEKNRMLLDYLRRAAGHDLSAFWHRWHMEAS